MKHMWKTAGKTCVGDGENEQTWHCANCGASHNTIFENGTRGDAGAGFVAPPVNGCRELVCVHPNFAGYPGVTEVFVLTCFSSTCCHHSHDAGYVWHGFDSRRGDGYVVGPDVCDDDAGVMKASLRKPAGSKADLLGMVRKALVLA